MAQAFCPAIVAGAYRILPQAPIFPPLDDKDVALMTLDSVDMLKCQEPVPCPSQWAKPLITSHMIRMLQYLEFHKLILSDLWEMESSKAESSYGLCGPLDLPKKAGKYMTIAQEAIWVTVIIRD
jgi:hypothetical protein